MVKYPTFEGSFFILSWTKKIKIWVSVHYRVCTKKLFIIKVRLLSSIHFFDQNKYDFLYLGCITSGLAWRCFNQGKSLSKSRWKTWRNRTISLLSWVSKRSGPGSTEFMLSFQNAIWHVFIFFARFFDCHVWMYYFTF